MRTKCLFLIVAGSGGLFNAVNPALAQNWTLTSAPTNSWQSVAISADGTKVAAVANQYDGDGLIYTSTNSGTTWTPTSAPRTNWGSVACSADGTKLVAGVGEFFVSSGSIFTSTDSGAT
jgi:hypothetical protein